MTEPVRAVLFDLDGTLVNSSEAILNAIDLMLAGYGFEPLTAGQKRSFVGKRLGESLKLWREDTDEMLKDFRRIYLETYMESTHVFLGIRELLTGIESQSIPMGIITLKTTVEARQVLEEMDLLEFFGSRIFGDNSIDGPSPYRIKPDPEHALWALRGMGVIGEGDLHTLVTEASHRDAPMQVRLSGVVGGRVCLVGDAAQDMAAATSAGLIPLGVLWGGRDPTILQGGGAWKMFSEPEALLAELLGSGAHAQ